MGLQVTLFKMAKNPIVVTRYFINEHEGTSSRLINRFTIQLISALMLELLLTIIHFHHCVDNDNVFVL